MRHDPSQLIKIESRARVFATYVLIGGVLLLISAGYSIARVFFSPTALDSSEINNTWIQSITVVNYLQVILGVVITFISLLAVSRIIRFVWMLKNLALRRKLAMRKKSH